MIENRIKYTADNSVILRIGAMRTQWDRRNRKCPKRCCIPESVLSDLAAEVFIASRGRAPVDIVHQILRLREIERDIRAGILKLYGMQVIVGSVFGLCR